jgi:hypothetical protein
MEVSNYVAELGRNGTEIDFFLELHLSQLSVYAKQGTQIS